MRDIIVYVEGPSDRAVLEQVLQSDIHKAYQAGARIRFVPTEGKQRLVTQIPVRAATQVLNDPHIIVFAVPDLYPQNVGGSHATFPELDALLSRAFLTELRRRGVDDERLGARFRPHCFQYDLEALLLAHPTGLSAHLGDTIEVTWKLPVEEQNHHRPPKRIVEDLFLKHERRYKDTRDAPVVLASANPDELARVCHLRFSPFLEDLRKAAGI